MATIPEVIETNLRAAGIPVVGVSTGNASDRSTWRVDFDPSATAAQRSQASTMLTTVAVDAAALAAQDERNAQAQIDQIQIELKAVVLAIIDKINDVDADIAALLVAVNALNTKTVLPATTLPNPTAPVAPAQALAAIRAKAGTL